MKKILFLIGILYSTLIYSQDYEPNQYSFVNNDSSKVIIFNSSDTNYQQKHFLKGWHWDSKKKINEALLINQVDIYCNHNWDVNLIQNNTMLVIKPGNYSHADDGSRLNARSIQYSPVLKIDSLNPERLIIRTGDTTNNVFGFKHILGDTTGYSLLIGSTLNNQVILSDPWPDNQIYMHGFKTDVNEIGINNDYLCQQMYLTINMRRNGIDNSVGTDTVLVIELPIIVQHSNWIDSNKKINFATVPKPNLNDTNHLRRGISRQDTYVSTQTNKIAITKNMIPINQTDITLKAKFIMDNTGFITKNPILKKNMSDTNSCIDKINIKVTYKGNLPIQINYVRLNTLNAERLLNGDLDSALTADIQNITSRFTSSDFIAKSPGSKIFRFNTIIEGSLFNWQAERYFNKLIGNIGTSEVLPIYPDHYRRYVNPPDRWFGLMGMGNIVANPYTRNLVEDSANLERSFGLVSGFLGLDTIIHHTGWVEFKANTLDKKSNYESFIVHIDTLFPINYFRTNPNDDTRYKRFLNLGSNSNRVSSLNCIENYGYKFIDTLSNKFIYSDKNWWGQLFTHTWWNYDSSNANYRYYQIQRPLTGEEFKYYSILPILVGGKGILYDGALSGGGDSSLYNNKMVFNKPKPQLNDFDILDTNSTIYQYLMNLNSWDFIKHDSTGSDFYSQFGEHYNLDKLTILQGNLNNLSNVANTLGIPKERIYMGRKSLRLETRKLHDWITINDSILMKLKLQSFYAHGYKIWYNQHPKHTNNNFILGNFIDTNKITTRRLFKYGVPNPKDSIEPRDSSFFDLTLLSHTSDSNMTKSWYLGYANRRTNPLILENDTLRFYSTAEFDDAVVKGMNRINGNKMSKNYWQNQFWKRMGARQINIPFNLPYTPPNYLGSILDEIHYLIIQELGVGTPYFSDSINYYWTQPKYYHKIDTTIRPNGTLISKLLPGQGKIVKVRWKNILDIIIQPDLTCFDIKPDLVFTVEKDSNRWDSCYYVLKVTSTSGWRIDTIDIKAIIKSDRTPSFLTFNSNFNTTFTPSDSSVFIRLDSLVNSQTVELGTFRIDCDEHFTVNYQFGRRVQEIYPHCDDDDSFEGDCTCGYQMRSSTSCCDNIDLYAAETTEDGQLSGKFNVFAKQNTTDCAVCEISLVRKFDTKVLAKLTKDKKEKKLNLTNFTNIGKISMDKSNGRSKDTLVAYLKDEDGKLICKKEIVLETLDWKQEKIIEINEPTESNTTDLSIRYYPNPVEELINIEINSDICKKVKVKLLTLKSEELFNKEVKTNALNQFSTEGISNGVYFLKIEDCESDKFIIKKIVIKR
jgi:hypothetical protein